MDRVFKSKVGWWFHFIILLMVAGCVKAFLSTDLLAMCVAMAVTALLIHMLLNTWYKVTADGLLVVHSSIFPEKKIAIAEITALEASVMPVSSPALSLDRLIIYKDDRQWILVSPVNRNEFVQLLRKFNPNIKLN